MLSWWVMLGCDRCDLVVSARVSPLDPAAFSLAVDDWHVVPLSGCSEYVCGECWTAGDGEREAVEQFEQAFAGGPDLAAVVAAQTVLANVPPSWREAS